MKNLCAKMLFLSSLLIFVGSCSTIQQAREKILTAGFPQYDGLTTAIIVPIQIAYKPSVYSYNIETIAYTKADKEMTEYSEFSGTCKVEMLGEMLMWDDKVTRITENGKTISPNLPIIEARALTDKYGRIKNLEVNVPALMETDIKKDVLEEITAYGGVLIKKHIKGLSTKPVRSGDAISTASLNDLLSLASGEETDLNLEKNLKFIVKGWSVYNRNKVVVVAMDETIGSEIADDDTSQMQIKGYALLDANTFHMLKMEIMIVINHTDSSGKKVLIKGLGSYSAALRKHEITTSETTFEVETKTKRRAEKGPEKDSSKIKLAIFPWKLTGIASQMNFVTINALKESIKNVEVFLPIYSYYDLGYKYLQKKEDNQSIFTDQIIDNLWIKKRSPYGNYYETEPDVKLVRKIGDQLSADAILMLKMYVDLKHVASAKYTTFIIGTTKRTVQKTGGSLINFVDNGPYEMERLLTKAFSDYALASNLEKKLQQKDTKAKSISDEKTQKNSLNWEVIAEKIERLGDLLKKGLITQEEYDRKKSELLKNF